MFPRLSFWKPAQPAKAMTITGWSEVSFSFQVFYILLDRQGAHVEPQQARQGPWALRRNAA
jgi:hypothetical protein